nr:uncharacterized protein LOC126056149 [Helicoverpa armigera]
MPVTRSQKSVPVRPPTRQEEEAPSSATGGATSEEASSATASTGTTGTEETSATTLTETTATTDTTVTTAASRQKKATAKKAPHQTPEVGEEEATSKKPAGAGRRPRSVKSTSSAARRRELEAREELARLELEAAQAATKLARVRLELAQCEDDDSDLDVDNEEKTAQVQDWIQTSVLKDGAREEARRKSPERPAKKVQQVTAKEEAASGSASMEVQTLAAALRDAFGRSGAATAPPKYLHELPMFDGSSSEWTAFRVVYEDTAPLFNEAQNMARLRRAIRGAARDSIKSLLYSEAAPGDVILALKRRFGRPEALVLAELEKVRALQRISDNPRDICVFASQVNNSVAAIKGLKRPQYLCSPEMVKQIVDKLPTVLKFRWYDYHEGADCSELSDLTMISEFLNKEADKCGAFANSENVSVRRVQRQCTNHMDCSDNRVQRQCTNHMDCSDNRNTKRNQVCPLCNNTDNDHALHECRNFLKMSVDDRWEAVKKSNICFKCLKDRHRKSSCRKPPCRICKRWHHKLLHSDNKGAHDEKVKEISTNVVAPVHTMCTTRAYLKMIPVEIYGRTGSKKIMALLDEGSTVSLLDAEVATEIGANGEKEELLIETVGGRLIRHLESEKLNVKIRGVHQNTKRLLERVRTMDNLKLAPQYIDKNRISACKHLSKLVHELCYTPESPRLLIGQDNWHLIVTREVRRGQPGEPVASRTNLGWVLHGTDAGAARPVNFINTISHLVNKDEEMHETIKRHFDIESLGVTPRRPSTDIEAQATDILESTCTRLEDGRFEAGLLWKRDVKCMPESYASAFNRLKNVERKLDKDSHLKKEYSAQIDHLITNGYAEKAPTCADEIKNDKQWYLPHFAVTHPVKKKIRIVFDAAARSRGVSLNDALLPGPDLLKSLFGVLLKFRRGPYAVAADIKEMFLQIKIREKDRDSLRFLWRGDNREITPTQYRMTSVIFGATSSPSTAIYVKNKNALEHATEYPAAAEAIINNHYMDDYLHSFHSETEFISVTSQVNMIHKKACFELRGWASNKPGLLHELIDTNSAVKTEVDLGEKEEKTLGLRWFTTTDKLGFRANLRNTPQDIASGIRTPTKREVTSAVMSTFDPLGLASPVLIQGKKLLQDIWRSGVSWDQQIENREDVAWRKYLQDVKVLQDLQIPRCLAPHCTEGELHTFTDASEQAYAAAVYWRTSTADGRNHTRLVAAKVRVTPLKPVSVPRLELQAALLGSRLARSVEEELDLQVERKVYWTDSSVVLSWIKTDPRTFKTFVAHRLAEVEESTRPQEWRWVPTALNPADDATRDVPEHFDANHRWFTGPDFLAYSEDKWPARRSFKTEPTGEERAVDAVATVQSVVHTTPDPARFSAWTRLLRATARVLQFTQLCRRRVHVHACHDPAWRKAGPKRAPTRAPPTAQAPSTRFVPLDAELLRRAELLLLARSQHDSFADDLRNLRLQHQLERGSQLRRLDVVLEDGVIKLRGRIDAVQGVSLAYRRPLVLDGRHQVARLIVAHYHHRFNHANHATVMNELRQHYWILGLRAALRAVQHHCQWCKLRRAQPHALPTGNLPAERLAHGCHPFTCTGVDYFGPMVITVGRRTEKRWGALFTCLTTRAVHMELVSSLSTDSMILALRRFAARRGMPRVIYSDNGTNFVGANKELQDTMAALQPDITDEAAKLGLQWKFIPPGAPHMGGAWERLVRSIKAALDATLKERHPKEEVLLTLLLEAEHVVNSRPLTHLAADWQEEALTPNHFLIGRSCGGARIGSFTDSELVGRHTWRTTQRLADHFWQRWLREYLPTLLPRKISGRACATDLRVGDVVLIVDGTLPRCTWPRGKVAAVYPGPDGRTRIVDVTTKGGVLRRPATRLVVLVEAPGESPSQEDGATHEGETVGDGLRAASET